MSPITIDVAGVIGNLALAGAAVLGVMLVIFAWRKVVGFFARS